jgi:site-specific recombinase XerD
MQQLELWSTACPDVAAPTTKVGRVELAPADSSNSAKLAKVPRDVLDIRVLEYLQASRGERTLRAYSNDWRVFERWCREHRERALPTSTITLVRYLTHLAESGKKASTIRRARIAIGILHGQLGLARPDRDARVRLLERGIGRTHGTHEDGATPLLVRDLERMMCALRSTVRDDRDRALLLLGFAGAFRSSELVAMNRADIEFAEDGVHVHIRRGKESHLGKGERTTILPGRNPLLCPVAALRHWLTRNRDSEPLFPTVRGSRVLQRRLAPRAVTRAVERAAALAKLPNAYSSHSLRSGLATSAYLDGRNARDIQAHGRWKDLRSLSRYIDASTGASRRATAGLL